jgi:hypothetical protein
LDAVAEKQKAVIVAWEKLLSVLHNVLLSTPVGSRPAAARGISRHALAVGVAICSDIDMMSSNADGRFAHKGGTYPERQLARAALSSALCRMEIGFRPLTAATLDHLSTAAIEGPAEGGRGSARYCCSFFTKSFKKRRSPRSSSVWAS